MNLNTLSGKEIHKIEIIGEEILIHFTDDYILSVYSTYDDFECAIIDVSIYDPSSTEDGKWVTIKE